MQLVASYVSAGIEMYAEDSFFTLSLAGRFGLIVLSVVLAALCLWIVWRVRHLKRAYRFLIALGLFWSFVWVSPQIYYLYYIQIFEGLPWQIVVKQIPTPVFLGRVLFFSEQQNLSFHGQALLGWALLLCALLPRRRRPG